MDSAVLGLAKDDDRIPNDSTSAPSKGKRGREGSQGIESKSYPLRSAHSSARVLRSTSKNESKKPNEPISPLRSAHNSARELRSTPENKRKTPQKPAKPLRSTHSSARVLRSAPENKRKTPKKPVKPLRSTHSSPRVVRATLKKNIKATNEPVNDNTAAQPTAKKRKRGRPSSAASPKNENKCIKIRQRVRYILNRMNYEQSLILAYASEGWKGQSSEKIRPEKELERAKAEILRCKLRIREAFRDMDSLLSEGKIDESLFDSEGEISSEDIFCAICGSKHVTLKNDIILCDGACDRGFHQKCLNPPLLAEDIPPEDEGWLCPACDCKLDCIDVLNELHGSSLAIHDSWEKVFPESASLANGPKQIGLSDLPSDDSEDDYDPTLAEGNMVDENNSSAEDGDEGSDSDDLDFMTSSDDSEPSTKKSSKSKNKNTVDDLGLPSEDSEDDDFDPEGPNSSEDQKTKTNSEESDFTSDSDDFCSEISKSCGQDEVLAPSVSDQTDGVEIMEAELEQDLVLPVSSRRQVGRLDYKKLFDEAYGKETSDPSDDEEWSGNSTHPKGNLEDSDSDSLDVSFQPTKTRSRRPRGGQQNDGHTPKSEQRTEVLHSNGSGSTGRKKHFGPIVSQKLKAHIEKDPYPSRSTKQSLAQELGLTLLQVTKWFASTRHYSRVLAAKKEKHPGNHSAENNDRMAEDNIRQIEPNGRVLKNPTVDGTDNFSEDRMAQDNPDEGKKEDTPFTQDISCEQTLFVTPTRNQNHTTNSREVGSPNGVPGENLYSGNSRNAEDTPPRQAVGLNQTVPMTPVNQKYTPDTSSVGSPGVSGGTQRSGTPRNVGSPRGRKPEFPGLEHVDEARRKAILRELRKMKKGR